MFPSVSIDMTHREMRLKDMFNAIKAADTLNTYSPAAAVCSKGVAEVTRSQRVRPRSAKPPAT